jgi:hypothetical protein
MYLISGMFCSPEGETKLEKNVIKVIVSIIIIVGWVWFAGSPIS